MYNVDDIVTYGINGVCKIIAIEEKILMGTAKMYFVLKPLSGEKSTYYVPADNKKASDKIRRILSEDEINQLIDSIPNEAVVWIDNERERKEAYKKIITNGNHAELIRMIKAIYAQKQEREEDGKRLHISDERFLKDAVKLLNDEFRYVLKLSEDDLMSYIFSRIESKG